MASLRQCIAAIFTDSSNFSVLLDKGDIAIRYRRSLHHDVQVDAVVTGSLHNMISVLYEVDLWPQHFDCVTFARVVEMSHPLDLTIEFAIKLPVFKPRRFRLHLQLVYEPGNTMVGALAKGIYAEKQDKQFVDGYIETIALKLTTESSSKFRISAAILGVNPSMFVPSWLINWGVYFIGEKLFRRFLQLVNSPSSEHLHRMQIDQYGIYCLVSDYITNFGSKDID
ncbi:hypothetical protein P9112_004852 [Eukaryota sp. TZLM1-RC]